VADSERIAAVGRGFVAAVGASAERTVADCDKEEIRKRLEIRDR